MLLPLTKPSRIKDGANNCIKTMPFYKFAGFKTSIADELLQLFHSLPFCWHITLERLCNSFAYGVKQLAQFSLGGIGKTPAVVNFHFVKVDLLGGCISVLHFIENIKHPRFEKFAFAFPSVSGDKITKNKKQSCTIGEACPISTGYNTQPNQKEHHNVIPSILCGVLRRLFVCVVHCAGTVVLNIQHLFCVCKKEKIATRAIPARVEVEKTGLRKNTPPANNLIWCRAVMCFYLLSVGLGMWVHIDLFLTRLGFCHKITSLLKSEARLGGSLSLAKKLFISGVTAILRATARTITCFVAYCGNIKFFKSFIFSTMWAVGGSIRSLQSSVCVPFATVFNGKRCCFCLALFG